MSAALVMKSLEIVDPDQQLKKQPKKAKVFDLIPENHKITKKVKGSKGKVNVLSTSKKPTITETRKTLKSLEQTAREYTEKLKKIQEVCRIKLDKNTTKKLLKRAVTKRPIGPKQRHRKAQKTAFTEEDFKKFKEEYVDE